MMESSTGMLFTYCPDNPEGAAHQLQLFSGISSVNRRSPGSIDPLASVAFRTGEYVGELFAGAGLPKRALHGQVIHPTGKCIAFLLKPVQVSFHLRDTTGYSSRCCRA